MARAHLLSRAGGLPDRRTGHRQLLSVGEKPSSWRALMLGAPPVRA